MSKPIITVAMQQAQDVVTARSRARQIAALVGFDSQDQTRIATAVSELARNAYHYAGRGEVVFFLQCAGPERSLEVQIRDRGPGIGDLAAVLDGLSSGLGIASSRRLVDRFDIHSSCGEGTVVTIGKRLPPAAAAVTSARIGEIAGELAGHVVEGPLAEVRQQDRELARVLNELHERQDAMVQLSRELDDTNRGVVALYAELDERADRLHRADEIKTRFFSSMSHELRTPLNSIRALSRLLLDRVDGPLTEEQVRQVTFIREATEDLTQIVDDLLDLAKIAAGKSELRLNTFAMTDVFGMLRGMLRPLLANEHVSLRFDDVESLPPLLSDEAKLSQILRNLISNALKYTEQGEVRVSGSFDASDETVCVRVSDTGIGIAPQDHDRIFEEFSQIANPLQARVKGTGLGLPLCRRLATLLGGTLCVESALGVGSTFILTLPLHHRDPAEAAHAPAEFAVTPAPPTPRRLIVLDDDTASFEHWDAILEGTPYAIVPTSTPEQAAALATLERPIAITIDLARPAAPGWRWLNGLRILLAERRIPIIAIASDGTFDHARALGPDACLLKPVERDIALEQLKKLDHPRILVIDDDPAARYAVRRLLDPSRHQVIEAPTGEDGLRTALATRPSLIVLDLQLPDASGEQILKRLRALPQAEHIPVFLVTSFVLDPARRADIERLGAVVYSKTALDDPAFGQTLIDTLLRRSPVVT